jgi:hypothetical protein
MFNPVKEKTKRDRKKRKCKVATGTTFKGGEGAAA